MTRDPMSQRVVRVPDDLWERAKEKAEARGESVSEVIRDRLEKYAPPPKAGAKHDGLGKLLNTILRDANHADDVFLVVLANLDGEPYVYSYPFSDGREYLEDDLNEFIDVAERLPEIEGRRVNPWDVDHKPGPGGVKW